MKLSPELPRRCLMSGALCVFFGLGWHAGFAQQEPQKPAAAPPPKSAEKADKPEKPANPAQIELLETKVRFESNGDSRKELHALVKINSELGVAQFARLNFDFNRSFESVEIPMVHITHASGGTADILPGEITDQPNPAVVNAPAYQDVRIKSVRILGLQPGDKLEYRVVKTVSHHPLAPDFWLDHSFDRTGVVSREIFELDLPGSEGDIASASKKTANFHVNPATPVDSIQTSGEGDAAHTIYIWDRKAPANASTPQTTGDIAEPDVSYSRFSNWDWLSIRLAEKLTPGAVPLMSIKNFEESMKELQEKPRVPETVSSKARELTMSARSQRQKLEEIYDFVSQKISTVDLPLGSTGFAPRSADESLSAGYATAEDKFVLFAALAKSLKFNATASLTGSCAKNGVALPSVFNHLLISTNDGKTNYWLDPSLEVAPFGMVSSLSQKCIFVLNRYFSLMNSTGHEWQPFNRRLPFAAFQKVIVTASLIEDGKLSAKVHYTMRGDNELVLRLTFHQSPKEKWKEVAQLLSLADGFRGQVTSVNVSDPYATKQPFSVEYELTQPKFVDWSKKTVRIPALLPQLGLPDPSAKPAHGSATAPIELGTPLEVETHMTLHLPSGTSATAPTGTSVERDYATYSSSYLINGSTLTASRHIKFILRQVSGARAADYSAFVHAVRSDEAQDLALERSETAPPKSNSAAPNTAASPNTIPPKP